MNLKDIMLSEISQVQKDKYFTISITCESNPANTKSQSHTESRMWLQEAGLRGKGEIKRKKKVK